MTNDSRRVWVLGLGAAALGGACLPQAWAQAPELTVGIVPQQSASSLARVWIPLLQAVAIRSGVRLVFRTTPDIPSFEDALAKGAYDLAYMNPYHYTVFSRRPGYQAFAKEKGRRLTGIIVVAKDSPARSLKDLAGQRVAFPAPAAFAASMLTRAEFERQQVPVSVQYVSSHDSVYRGVARGLFAAGGGIQRTLESMEPEVTAQLRVLVQTPSYVPHAFAAHPRVAPALLERVRQAMLALANDAAGLELLKELSFKGIDPATDAEWNEIRRLKFDQATGKQ
ncbi:phosphate/phosphite/phosphonate ABC transporter substrate-binding protein [Macromonas nakdongensis]|uniref:phosphate/phosphite/phosphonate ABC transporter substrate-binding protein n=1 Tax=Macromonas nakdongensis TaxID=1843082 RepID=UPI000C321E46|nr:phosphate/phosphite/phosphonate ABC transporter substrate-binding protein [Macromonas nakdongensis]